MMNDFDWDNSFLVDFDLVTVCPRLRLLPNAAFPR